MRRGEHHLKTWPECFEEIVQGNKTFDLRENDRGFKTGDILILEEWDPETEVYTGRQVTKRIGFFIQGEWGLSKTTCAMSLIRPMGVDPKCPNCDGTGGALRDGSCGSCWNAKN